ncbi:MAG TPA: hypothetical protein VKB80_01285 [Kofleriaceae bacterium]|nr:hypothetical protein [Kofleriaceae bacterium]
MSESERWIEIVDREGLLLLAVEGSYLRYGFPFQLTIRRELQRYHVRWTQDSDGVGPMLTGEETHDRAGLERYLDGVLADGRPVHRIG